MTLYKGAARLDSAERGSFAKRGLAAWENLKNRCVLCVFDS